MSIFACDFKSDECNLPSFTNLDIRHAQDLLRVIKGNYYYSY